MPTRHSNSGKRGEDAPAKETSSQPSGRAAAFVPHQSDPLPPELANPLLSRRFLPGIDLAEAGPRELEGLGEAEMEQIAAARLADITHFRVGLDDIREHMLAAKDLIPQVQTLPGLVRGLLVNPDGAPAERVSVQPSLPSGGAALGRAVLTDSAGVFELPLPPLGADERRQILAEGLGLRVMGTGAAAQLLVVPLPRAGQAALGELALKSALRPLRRSLIGALVDLVEGLPGVTEGVSLSEGTQAPVQIRLGQDACNIRFEEDAHLRRFPYKMLVRLVEPRTTTVNRTLVLPVPRRGGREGLIALTDFNTNLGRFFGTGARLRYVERVPVDKPISVDGFRDQVVGVSANTIGTQRTVPMAGTLGLGYVLNMAQVWRYDGLALGNLLYSLPLAPGEQQRIAVAERRAQARVVDTERVDMAEEQRFASTDDASTSAVFQSAFRERVNASSSYENEASSWGWGVAGGVGGFVSGVLFGIGAGGGGGGSSNSGSTRSALSGARTYATAASEEMHRAVEQQSSARRSASRVAIRLASTSEREAVTSKVITNHNKMHALTVQYWEVLRKFRATTEVEGCTLVCFVPLDLVRFLPAGQLLALTDTSVVDTRAKLVTRYALLQRHADVIRPRLPRRHLEGLRLLEDFCADTRAGVDVTTPGASTLNFRLHGSWLPFERVTVDTILRSGRRLRRVQLTPSVAPLTQRQFGTRDELLAHLRGLRNRTTLAEMSGTLLLPQSVPPSEVAAFEINRRFDTLHYAFDLEKIPEFVMLKSLVDTGLVARSILDHFERAVRLAPAELEELLGSPAVQDFRATLNGTTDNVAADDLGGRQEFAPSGIAIPATEIDPVLGHRDVMKIERMLQHVVRNTMAFSRAVWASLSAEERVVMLEGYTIGLPQGGLDAEGLTDASQNVPLLNCVANQVLGFYGNCMILPFSIPASLAVLLNRGAGEDEEPLTTGAVQDALTEFHRAGFSPPVSRFTLPTRGVLGEAVLGHCSSAEKIDLTRFWNWRDSPGPEATAIDAVAMRGGGVQGLAAPATLTGVPQIVTNVQPGALAGTPAGALAQALAARAETPFSTDYLGHAAMTALGGKTIDSAEAARKDALGAATSLASQAMTSSVDLLKAAKADAAKADAAKGADKPAGPDFDGAVKLLKERAPSYLGGAQSAFATGGGGALAAGLYAQSRLLDATGGKPLPPEKADLLRAAYTDAAQPEGTAAWLRVLGLQP